MVAVRHARAGSETAITLAKTFVGNFLFGDLLPQNLARLPVQRHEHELLNLGRLLPAAHATTATAATRSARPARSAAAAGLGTRQDRVQGLAQLCLVQRAGRGAVP